MLLAHKVKSSTVSDDSTRSSDLFYLHHIMGITVNQSPMRAVSLSCTVTEPKKTHNYIRDWMSFEEGGIHHGLRFLQFSL